MPVTLAAVLGALNTTNAAPRKSGELESASRPRRILYVSHVATPGGGELSLIDLLEVLDRQRFAPSVVVPHSGELTEVLERAGIVSLLCPSLKRLYRMRAPLPALRQMVSVAVGALRLRGLIRRERPDLIHANSTIGALYALLAPMPSRPPVVWHSRDMTHDGIVERWLGRRVAGIIATSDACRARLARVADPAKIELIANGIRLRESQTAAQGERQGPAALRRQLGLPDGEGPLLVAVGQLVAWKAFDVAIDAVRRVRGEFPQVRLLVVGEDRFGDSPGVARQLRQRIAEGGLAETVSLLGQRSDVRDILACADLLVHPAYPEPFGRVIVEAMAEGCPAVAFDGDHGPAEVLRHDVDGLLATPRTPEALASAIAALLRDPERRKQMSRAGQQRARDSYDRSQMARRIEDLYARLLAGPRSAGSADRAE